METKYPTLKRSKRKLCYFPDKDRPTKQWTGMISLGDIDRMFDDLEPSDHEEDVVLPSSPLLHIDDTEVNQSDKSPSPLPQQERRSSEETRKSPKGRSEHASPSPGKDLDLDGPSHGPIKTSSPIEERKALDVRVDDNKDGAMSPILFLCEDDREQAKLHSPKCISSHSPVTEKANRKPATPASPENTLSNKEVVAHKHDAAAVKTAAAADVHTQPLETRLRQVDESITFLQRLRDTQAAAPSSSRKPVSPVKAPIVPEEEFFILEDEAPLLFCIPRTMSSSKRHRRTSGTVSDGQAGNRSPGNASETVEKEQDVTDATKTHQSPVIHELKKKRKEKVKKSQIPEPPEKQRPPVADRLVHEKPIKKQNRVKQVYFGKSEANDVKPQDTAGQVRTDSEEPPRKRTKKSPKHVEVKKAKAVKEKNGKVKMGRRGAQAVKEVQHLEDGTEDKQEQSNHEDGQTDQLTASPSGEKKRPGKEKKLTAVLEESSSSESQGGGKRQRKPPGQWWVSGALGTEGSDAAERQPTAKKIRLSQAASKQSPARRKKDKDSERPREKESVPSSSSQKTSQVRDKMPRRKRSGGQVGGRKSRKTKATQRELVETNVEQQEEEEEEVLDSDPLHSSPGLLPPQGHSSGSGDPVFRRVYQNPSARKASTAASSSQPEETGSDRRRRKTPCDWWVVGNSPLPQPQPLKPVKGRKKVKPNKALGLGSPRNGNVAVSSKPQGGAPGPLSSKEATRRSLAPFMDSLPTAVESPSKAGSSRKVSRLRSKQEVSEGRASWPRKVPEDASRSDASEANRAWASQNNTSKVIVSGPCSMIQLEDDQDDMVPPSSRLSAVLSVSDLCAPPLEPLVLQPKDKGNLSEWFRSLWSVESGADVTPEQFDWYFYQGRAFGLQVDLDCGTFCSGKMLLGSHMKKPLWVDHSATTVFHLLTSSVNVVVNGSGSRFHPAQAFVVPCGHAYSIQNASAQPAVLYFTRMFSETSD